MTRCIETRLSGIVLPPDFVQVECKDPFHYAYFHWDTLKPFLEAGKLLARFEGVTNLCLITYGNKRRLGLATKSEELVEGSSQIPSVSLLQWVVMYLVHTSGHLQDGHDAFLFTRGEVWTPDVPRLCADIVQPRAYPGDGSYWKLIGVIERT